MVGYQEFISLVFDVARDRGRSIDTLEESQDVLSIGADLWTNKGGRETLHNASQSTAKDWIRRNA